ncbi:MAG: molybdenum ABC transporter ATP-binding protein [Pseudomonadota bacterium]
MSLRVRISHKIGATDLDVDFQASGGVTALFGPSGAGKTSVINAVAGLLRPDAGRITFEDEVLFDSDQSIDTPVHRRRAGYVFQDARLFPHLDVAGNLEYGQRFATRKLPMAPVVDLLGLGALLSRRPTTLSGGETQRVAIGRALLADPRLLLMDEPLAALDAARKDEILPYLDRLRAEAGIPILYVSHAMAEIARLADTLVVLRGGRVLRQGALDDVLSDPEAVPDLGVREAGAILNATMLKTDTGDGLSELRTSAGRLLLPGVDAPSGAGLRVRIRASDIIISRDAPQGLSALNVLPCTVGMLHEGDGPGVAVALTSGSDRLVARITARSAAALQLSPGSSCFAIVKAVSVSQGDIGRNSGPPANS